MGSFLNQARHNEKLLELLDINFSDDFFDWKVTVAFYATVHYMNAYLADKGVAVRDHTHRNCELNPDCRDNAGYPLPEAEFLKFFNIYMKSRAVRYHGMRNRTLALKKWKADYDEIKPHVLELKEWVLADLEGAENPEEH